MNRALLAESLKIRTTRGFYGLLLGAIGVVLLGTLSTVISARADALTGEVHDQVFFLLTSINVGLFSLILGTRVATDEYRHSTIAHSFLSYPGRRTTIVAKATTAAVAAAVIAVMSALAMVLAALPAAAAKGGSLSVSGSAMAALGGFILANALWGVIGVGVGFIVRHQVAAIVGGIIWVMVIENLGSGFLGDAGAYLPGQSAYALAQALDGMNALRPSTAGIMMTIYAVAITAIAVGVTRRRDVV